MTTYYCVSSLPLPYGIRITTITSLRTTVWAAYPCPTAYVLPLLHCTLYDVRMRVYIVIITMFLMYLATCKDTYIVLEHVYWANAHAKPLWENELISIQWQYAHYILGYCEPVSLERSARDVHALDWNNNIIMPTSYIVQCTCIYTRPRYPTSWGIASLCL